MVVGPAIGRSEIDALKQELAGNPDCAVGLHTTLTAPFHPLTMHFQPLDGGRFLSLGNTLQAALLRRFDTEMVQAELQAQLTAFNELFGRVPDYIDGHQHVQLFPQIRDAFVAMVKATTRHKPGCVSVAEPSRCPNGSATPRRCFSIC